MGFDPESIFSQFFGGGFGAGKGSRSGFVMPGEDIQVSISLSFMEAAKGCTKKVHVQPLSKCEPCKGHGTKEGKKPTTCYVCKGSGQEIFNTMHGMLARTCGTCGGSGTYISRADQCGTCDGLGRVRKSEYVDVDIPAGIDNKVRMVLQGRGDCPVSGDGPAGDLYIVVNVQKSKIYSRHGQDLHVNAQVPFHVAALGGFVRIPTIDGDVEIKIHPGTQTNDEMVLKRKGLSKPQSKAILHNRGDQYVHVNITVPKSLSLEQKRILEDFAVSVDSKFKRTTPGPSFNSNTEETEHEEGSEDKKKSGFFGKIFGSKHCKNSEKEAASDSKDTKNNS
jgi:molecular chaperone DnaJ